MTIEPKRDNYGNIVYPTVIYLYSLVALYQGVAKDYIAAAHRSEYKNASIEGLESR